MPRGYALDGPLTTFYPGTGQKEYAAVYADGRPLTQQFFDANGNGLLWRWEHDLARGNSSLVQYWDGDASRPRLRSQWLHRAHARDWARVPTNKPASFRFDGLVADGPALIFGVDGALAASSKFEQGELVQAEERSRA